MKYQELQTLIREPYVDTSAPVLARAGVTLRPSQIMGWVKEGRLVQVRRGLYVFSDRKELLDVRVLAGVVYGPSYLSLQTALRYYDVIPEIVPAVTSVTARTTRTKETDFGRYIYRHVRADLYFGMTTVATQTGVYHIAEPEKAILDSIYLSPAEWCDADAVSALRVNREACRDRVHRKKFETYQSAFHSQAVDRGAYHFWNYVDA